MNLQLAKLALIKAGFSVSIDCDTDGLIELTACKNGSCEIFYDSNLENHCSNYLCQFDTEKSIVDYANKSIKLNKLF